MRERQAERERLSDRVSETDRRREGERVRQAKRDRQTDLLTGTDRERHSETGRE